jgi:hypothetical protein
LVGFPTAAPPAEQSVFVSDPDVFMENTAIEAFPDPDPDAVAPDAVTAADYDGLRAELADDSDICDLPADLDEVLRHPYRTSDENTAPGDPLVTLKDVKPGDFGEVTFGFHICGNPGFVWLTGEGVPSVTGENGLTEPEADDPDEEPGVVELLDAIQVAVWYDTGADGVYGADNADKDAGEGDNRFGAETFTPLRGSLRNVLTVLEQGGLPLDPTPVPESGGAAASLTAVGEAELWAGERAASLGDGGVHVAPSVTVVTDASSATIYDNEDLGVGSAANITCAELGEFLGRDLIGSKWSPAGDQEDDELLLADGPYTTPNGTVTLSNVDIQGGTVTITTDFAIQAVMMKGGNTGERIYVFGEDGVQLQAVDFRTGLNPDDQPAGISHIEICYATGGTGEEPTPTPTSTPTPTPTPEPTPTAEPGGGPDDERCFPNSTTAYIGFEWWLPVDHANEIQSDSVGFNLGFYTEQCRHNDGDGMMNTEDA